MKSESDQLLSLARMLEDLLSAKVGTIKASRYIANARFKLKQEQNPLFLPFTGISSDTDKFPLEEERKLWATDALARYDLERELLEKQLSPVVFKPATELLIWVQSQLNVSSS